MPVVFALPLLAMSLMLPVGGGGEPVALRVTTESAEYCAALSDRAEGLRNPPARSLTLADEGRRLCATGHLRTGIAKLRRAIRGASQAEQRASG